MKNLNETFQAFIQNDVDNHTWLILSQSTWLSPWEYMATTAWQVNTKLKSDNYKKITHTFYENNNQ